MLKLVGDVSQMKINYAKGSGIPKLPKVLPQGSQSLGEVTHDFEKILRMLSSFIIDHVGWTSGDGENMSVWNCNWVPCENGLRKPNFSSL